MLALIADSIFGKLASGVLGLWLKDKQYLALMSDVAITKAQSHAEDAIAARQFARFIQQIEDDVATSLAAYLASEFRELRSGDKVLLLEKAIATIRTEEFYQRCFYEAFDQERVLESYHSEICTYADEIKIADHHAAVSIFGYCVAKFLSIIDSLPNFSNDALRNLLKDTDEILERIQNVEVAINKFSTKKHTELDEDEKFFRKQTSRRLRKIDVFGVDSRELPKRYDLSIAYLNLTLSSAGEFGGMGTQQVLSAAFVPGTRLVVVKGDPGSGKTTLLSYLALKVSEQKLRGPFEHLNDKLPVFLRVREFAETSLPTGARLITSLFGNVCDSFTDEWLRKKLQEGNLILFIDGFDEVTSEKRMEISRWLQGILDAYPDAIAVVSCRPYAQVDLGDVTDEFSGINNELTVEPMNPRQVKEFINRWYKSFAIEISDIAKLERLRTSRVRLFERINTNSSLRSLTRNPLICSLICFVNADRDGFVPDQRGELYDLATETLVERRERERGIEAFWETRLSKAQKFKILGFIAEFFYKKHTAQLDLESVATALREYLPALKLEPSQSKAIVEHMSERSHVLRSPSIGYIDFSHKTFLEYFYARRLCEQGLFELTAAEFLDSEFREVFLFSMAIGGVPFVNGAVKRILDSRQLDSVGDKSAILTLYAGINQAAELNPDIRARALRMLDRVLPPKSDMEAEELSLAGDVILEPLMSYADPIHGRYLTYIVDAILYTFSEHAIYTLRPFSLLGIPAVDEALGRGRSYFEDDEQYREVVLRNCKTLESLTVTHWSDLALVQTFPSLKTVYFSDFDGNWDDAKLEVKETIEHLSIVGARQVSDLKILHYLPRLKSLEIRGCEQVQDFSQIGNLVKLEKLEIASLNLNDLGFLKEMKRLTRLDLSDCTRLEDVSILNRVFSLRTLYLPYSHLYDQLSLKIEDLEIELDVDFFDSSGPSDDELDLIDSLSGDIW